MIVLVSVFPMGKSVSESLAADVAEALDEIDKSGLDYRLTAMGTILEGEWDAVMRVVKKMRERLLKRHARLYMTLALDERRDDRPRLKEKVESVEKALGRALRK